MMAASPSIVCSRIQSVSSLAQRPVFRQAQQLLHGSTLRSMARMISDWTPSSSAAIRAAFRRCSLLPFFLPQERPMILSFIV